MQSIARDSDDSSDDEYFDAHGMWSLNYHHLLPEMVGEEDRKHERLGGERGRKQDFLALFKVRSFLTKLCAASVQLLRASPASLSRLLYLSAAFRIV